MAAAAQKEAESGSVVKNVARVTAETSLNNDNAEGAVRAN
jgi:hypothetical protein